MQAPKVYRILLRLYPRDHRALFAEEMLNAFREAAEEQRGPSYWRWAAKELAGLVSGACSEWIAKFTGDPSIRGRTLPDRLKMRPAGVAWESFYGEMLPDALSDELKQAERRTQALVGSMVHAIAHHDFEGARNYARQEREARETLRVLRAQRGIAE